MSKDKNKEEKSIIGRIVYFIVVVILLFTAYKLYDKYKVNNFNDFISTEYIPYTSEFLRDKNVKYTDVSSYKIVSTKENDAMFYKEITVIPNTPYKVTCMVKTKDVKTVETGKNGGAHISIADTTEKSKSITGTNDWQRLEFIFNSKNRTSVNIGFRLGGYDDNCTGTAWFSDFTIEKGSETQDSNWKFACLVFENTNGKIEKDGQKSKINLTMNMTDIADMRQNMARFKSSFEELSKNKISITYDFITIKEPIISLSYDTENGYFVAPQNVSSIIEPYLRNKSYDHIFACLRLGDNEHQEDIPVYDWIGLGGMDYLGIGFSNIRLPNSNRSYIYKYDARINTFPEEVFVHEFLHSLERNAKEYGYTIPELHDYSKYGYKEERLEGLKKWYQDYMNGEIKTSSGYIGLPKDIYKYKPNSEEDFEYSYSLDEFKEPSNIFEEIKMIIEKAFENVTRLTIKKEENQI